MGKPIVISGRARRSLWIAEFTLVTTAVLIANGEAAQQFTGRFDHHLVDATWNGQCATYSHTTNTYSNAVVMLPMSLAPRASSCIDGKLGADATLALIFPDTTPPAVRDPNNYDSLLFDTPLTVNVSLEGELTIASGGSKQTLTLTAGPLGAGTTNTCPFSTVTHGPPLAKGAYPLTVMWSCERNSLTSPEREGTDLVYKLRSTVSIQLQDTALAFPSSFLLGGTFNIISYYRVSTAGGMQLDPGQLAFVVTRSNPPPQTVTIKNDGNANLTFQVGTTTENGKSWLRVEPLAGTLTPGQTRNLSVSLDSTSLNAGTNTGLITVTGNAANSPQTVPVKVVATDVELVALEVIQTVQNWQNTVPLVSDKPTLLRAHFQLLRPDIPPPKILQRQGFWFRGFRDGVELADSPIHAANAGGILVRANANEWRATTANSLNFYLPTNWLSGDLELRLEPGLEPILFSEPAEPGGVPGDGRVHVHFNPVPELNICFVQVRWTNDTGTVFQPGTEVVEKLKHRLLAGFPVSRVNATRMELISASAPPDLDRINASILLMRLGNISNLVSHRLFYGIITGHECGGLAQWIPATVASGSLESNPFGYSRSRHLHELGHALGQHHPVDSALGLTTNGYKQGYCGEVARITAPDYPFFATFDGIGTVPALGDMNSGPEQLIYGFDQSAQIVVDPYSTAELMGYCEFHTMWRWPSVYTYTNLWLAISNRFRPAPAIHAAGLALEWQNYLVVRGTVNLATGTAQFLPFTWLRTPYTPDSPLPGEYQLEFLDAAGSSQRVIPFGLVTGEPDYPAPPPETGSFLIPVPANPAIRQVRLRHNGAVILSRGASPRSPLVRVVQPNGGETIGTGPAELEWTGTDADGDALSYVVQYSADNGGSWETLVVDWPQTRYTIDAEFLRGATEGRIRVIASDGFNTAVDESDKPFIVLNHPPNASIRMPAPGTLFSGEQAVILAGAVNDTEDESLPAGNLQWTSDVDGPIGAGEFLQRPASAFTEGPHLIRLTARDAHGSSNTATVQIVIGRQVPSDLADLELAIDAFEALSPNIVFPIRIENHGPTDAKDVQITAQLPPGMILLSATASAGSCSHDSSSLYCLLGTLVAGEPVNIEVRLQGSGVPSGPVHIQAATRSTDPVPANNVASLVLASSPVQPESVRLALRMAAGKIILSWPASATGYVIESTGQLAGPDPWQEHKDIEQIGEQNVFQVAPAERCRFYRLRCGLGSAQK